MSKESEQSSHQVSGVGPLDSRQAPPPWDVRPERFPFNTGEDDEEPYLRAPTGYVPSFLGVETDTVPQKSNPKESMPQKSVTQEPTFQVSTKDAIDTPKNVSSWASDTEAQVNYPPSIYDRNYS